MDRRWRPHAALVAHTTPAKRGQFIKVRQPPPSCFNILPAPNRRALLRSGAGGLGGTDGLLRRPIAGPRRRPLRTWDSALRWRQQLSQSVTAQVTVILTLRPLSLTPAPTLTLTLTLTLSLSLTKPQP